MLEVLECAALGCQLHLENNRVGRSHHRSVDLGIGSRRQQIFLRLPQILPAMSKELGKLLLLFLVHIALRGYLAQLLLEAFDKLLHIELTGSYCPGKGRVDCVLRHTLDDVLQALSRR